MKTLKINLEADISDDMIEDMYDEFGVSSDVELAAFLKGIYISCMSNSDAIPVDRISITIDSDEGCGGIMN